MGLTTIDRGLLCEDLRNLIYSLTELTREPSEAENTAEWEIYFAKIDSGELSRKTAFSTFQSDRIDEQWCKFETSLLRLKSQLNHGEIALLSAAESDRTWLWSLWQSLKRLDFTRDSFRASQAAFFPNLVAFTREPLSSMGEVLKAFSIEVTENSKTGTEMPHVEFHDDGTATIRYNGETFGNIDFDGAKIIQELIDHYPSPHGLTTDDRPQPARIIAKLPATLKAIIKTDGNKGRVLAI
jgi:hypothetical protein